MKKLISTLLACSLILTAFSTTALAAAPIADDSITSVVEEYLQAQANTKYLFEDEDLTAHTVSDLSQSEMEVVQKALLKSSPEKSEKAVSIKSLDTSFAEYMEEKARYIQYTREAEGLEISDYSVEYGSPQVTTAGDMAQVKITELVSMKYEGLDDMSSISTNYVVDLINVNDKWVIADISSDDLFDQVYEDGFDYQTAVTEYNEAMVQPGEIVVEQETREQVAELMASGATVYPYNNSAGAYYSLNYTTSTGVNTQSYYNSNFAPYHGFDCMNFASQCMYAGFGGSDDVSAINSMGFPMDRQGSSNSYDRWYTNASGGSCSGSWIGTLSFQNYASRVNGVTPSQDNMYVDMYLPSPSAGVGTLYNYQSRLPGSVVFVLDGEGDLGHAMVISKVTGPATSQIFVSAHTNDVKLQPLSQCISNSPYRIVVPNAFYAYTNAPALRVVTKWHDVQPLNTTLNLTATATRKSGGSVYRMAMSVTTPSGKTVWLGEVMNTNNYSKTYKFTEKGLYRITTFARETASSPSNVSNTASLRIY